MRSLFGCAAFVLVLFCASPAQAQTLSTDSQNRWEYTGAIYLWGADLGGRTINGSEIELGFSQLVDNLEMGFMGAFAAKKNDWSFLTDVIYLDLSADKTADLSIPVGPVQVPVTTATELNLAGWVVHFAGGYELTSADNSSNDLLAGVRYLDLDMDLFLELESLGPGQSRTVSESLTAWDFIVAVKGRTSAGERWYFPYYLDIGVGDSDFTWQASAGVGFQAGKSWDVVLVYRYLEWDLGSTRVIDDLDFSGPALGAVFRW